MLSLILFILLRCVHNGGDEHPAEPVDAGAAVVGGHDDRRERVRWLAVHPDGLGPQPSGRGKDKKQGHHFTTLFLPICQ